MSHPFFPCMAHVFVGRIRPSQRISLVPKDADEPVSTRTPRRSTEVQVPWTGWMGKRPFGPGRHPQMTVNPTMLWWGQDSLPVPRGRRLRGTGRMGIAGQLGPVGGIRCMSTRDGIRR